MSDPEPPSGLTRTRLFLLVFFGIAVLLAIMTIVGTLRTERENAAAAPVETDAGK